MRSILVATDLTPAADTTLRAAAHLAGEAGAALHVVHAMGLIGLTLREVMRPLHDGTIPRARQALEEQVRRTIPSAVGPASHALDFEALPRAIAVRSEQIAADLVIVAASGPRSAGAAGSAAAATELAGCAAVPILLATDRLRWPPRRVRWAMDAADLDAAVAWLGRLGIVARQGGWDAVELEEIHAAWRPHETAGDSAPATDRAADLLVVAIADQAMAGRRHTTAAGPVLGVDGAPLLLLPPARAAPATCSSGGDIHAPAPRREAPAPIAGLPLP